MDCVSLQVHKPNIKLKHFDNNSCKKRVSLFAFQDSRQTGSVTIEALIASSLFMMAVVFVMNFMIMVSTEMAVQIHINNIAQSTAKLQFYRETADEASDNIEGLADFKNEIFKKMQEYLAPEIISDNAEEILKEKLNEGYLLAQLHKELKLSDSKFLSDIRNIRISDSAIENGIVDFVLRYEMKVPVIDKYFTICQRARVKDWTGTDIAQTAGKVYITKNGTVYHKTKECSHLIVRISKTNIDEVPNLRNDSGGKYYACEHCAKGNIPSGTSLFITEDGDRYHLSLQCGGITRHIIEVDISQVSDKKPCSECYGED